jgi:hypothetical protein
MANNDYRYVTTQLYQSGSTPNPVIAELPFTRVNFTSQLSTVGTFTGELLLSGIDASTLNVDAGTIPGKVALYVFKGSAIYWSGIIWNREWDSSTQILKITAQEMISYYQHRRISGFTSSSFYNANAGGTGIGGLVYTAQDPITILSDILTGANAISHGNIGILKYGSSSSGGSVTRTYFDFEMKSVYQAWKDLSTGSTFFDFNISSQQTSTGIVNQLFVYSPTTGATYSASSVTSTNLQFPGNLVSYNYVEDGSRVANRVWGVGYGANQNRLITPYYDTDKLGTGKTWPLLEDTVNAIDVINLNLLNAITSGKLAAISYPPTTIQAVIPSYIDPTYDKYNLGDQVKLMITDDRFPSPSSGTPGLNAIYRIIGIDTEPGEDGPDRITLTLNLPLATTLTNS